MEKIIALILVFLLTFCIAPALAENITIGAKVAEIDNYRKQRASDGHDSADMRKHSEHSSRRRDRQSICSHRRYGLC